MAEETYKRTSEKEPPSSESSSLETQNNVTIDPVLDENVKPHESLPRRIVNSFKRDPNARAIPRGGIGSNGQVFDVEAAAYATAASPLARKLKGRHLQMIAIGGSIGTGLFVASGKSLETGGPASVLIAYTLIGGMLYCTVQALGELAVIFPVAGSFAAYSTRFLDPAWGFAMGWNYAMDWLVVLPLEIVSASITVQFWGSTISPAIWVAIFLTIIVSINLFDVRGYGEAEFIFSIIKVVVIIGYIILGVVLDIGGGPKGEYIGGKYWVNPGAFNNGFKGLCSVFVTASFAFGGTELVGLAAAETANPRKSLPTAVKQVFWRITLFYIVSLTLVGLLVPHDDPRLIGNSSADAKASPFVISIKNAGLQGLDSVMNVVIMISVISVGNTAIYGSSRVLAALAEQSQAPSCFRYIDRKGRPLVAILFASSLGLLAFLAVSHNASEAFVWMAAVSGLSDIFTWGSICLSHIRFRRAWQLQGHSVDELPFKSQAGVIGSWIGVFLNCIILVTQFWIGFSPPPRSDGSKIEGAKALTINFFQSYTAAPIVIIFFLGHKMFYGKGSWGIRARDMDLQHGMRELNLSELVAEERLEQAAWPRWKKLYKLFC